MEELLIPEVSLSVDDKADVADGDGANKDSSNDVIRLTEESEISQNADNSVCDVILDPLKELENIDPATIPDEFTAEELEYFQKLESNGARAVQFHRVHCTACDKHLGSAPANQNSRYIHPLLKVWLCKRCYTFYCSGEFEKDEDGSELYCRWCGEGGNVLCCAQCPYVFCKKCIRRNLGRRKLDTIKESDDWLCFVCVPSQLLALRVNTRALYQFVLNEMKFAESISHGIHLNVDHSLCCQNKPKPKSAQPKRKRASTPDVPYDPFLDNVEGVVKKKKVVYNNNNKHKNKEDTIKPINGEPEKIWDSQEEDEVVCTPDLSLFMEDEESDTLDTLNNSTNDNSEAQHMNENSIGASIIRKPPPPTPAAKKIYTIAPPSPVLLRPILPKPLSGPPPLISSVKPVMPTIKLSNNVVGNGQSVITVTHNLKKTAASTRLMPGLKHDWFDRAMQLSARVNQNLSTKLTNLSSEQSTASTLEELAAVHNRLQEILSSSINSLIQIRKNLRNEFLNGLNNLKFTSTPTNNPPPPSDDDDVILVEGNDEKPPEIVPPKAVSSTTPATNSGQYIKVKPISKLTNLEAPIEILDDAVSEPKESTDEPLKEIKDEAVNESRSESPKNNSEIVIEDEEKSTSTEQNEKDAVEHKPEDELQGIDENLNPEVVKQIKKAIEQSKLEKLLHDSLNVANISTEELRKMISVRVILERKPLEAILLRARRAKIQEKRKMKTEEIEDIEQLLETSIVPKTSIEIPSSPDSTTNDKLSSKVNDFKDKKQNSECTDEQEENEVQSSDEESDFHVDEEEVGEDKIEENDEEIHEVSEDEHETDEKAHEDKVICCDDLTWDRETKDKSKREENSNDPHTVDSGIDVECDRGVSKTAIENSGYHEDDVLSVSSHEDNRDKDFRTSFASEVECDA